MPGPRSATLAALAAAAAGAVVAGVALAAPGDLSVVSVSQAGTPGGQPAEAAAVSADGRHVAFTSAADLTGVATGGVRQLYVRDRAAGTTRLASATEDGQPANAAVDAEDAGNVLFAISADGRYVVFAAAATNLTPADADPARDVYRKDMVSGAVALVSVSSTGAKAGAAVAGDPDVSADGAVIAFGTGQAANLIPGDGNGASDVAVRDVPAGITTAASVRAVGGLPNGTTERPAISADGRFVAFEAPAGTNDVVPGDTGGGNDVFVRDLAAGTTAAVSDPALAVGSGFPDISGDGRHVAFETGFAYDPAADANAVNDAYRRDRATGAVVVASARDGLDAAGDGGGVRPAISADGTRVAFASTSANLTTDGNAAVRDVFVRDLPARTTRLASVRADGATQSLNPSDRPAIAADGGPVAFVFDDAAAATGLVEADANARPDALLKELAPSDDAGPALTVGAPADGASQRDAQVTVSGTATDPSGLAGVTVNGNPVALRAGGAFSAPALLQTGPNSITVVATDGAGNATARTLTVLRTAPRPARRVLGFSASMVRGRIVLKINLSAQARVRFTVLRRTAGPPPRRVVSLLRVGPRVLKVVKPGRRIVRLVPPTRAPGRYAVRVQIVGATGRAATRTDAFLIRATRRR
jgi:Tol biopolymer transport system component